MLKSDVKYRFVIESEPVSRSIVLPQANSAGCCRRISSMSSSAVRTGR